MTIRIGLADDQPLFTAGLAMVIDAQPDMTVLWQAIDGADAVRQHHQQPADIVLLDVQMPVMDGLEATLKLVEHRARCQVVILTTFDTDDYVLRAVEAGASGFLLKNTPPSQLLEALRTVHRGDSVISPESTRRLLTQLRPGGPTPPGDAAAPPDPATQHQLDSLTDREAQVLTLMAQAMTNGEICDRLFLSMPTVKTYVGNILAKTQSRDRVQAVLFALRAGLITLEQTLVHPTG